MDTTRPIIVWGFADEYRKQREGTPIASHAFIHAGYAKAFQALGFDCQWRDAGDVPANAVVFCMNTRADNLPIRPDLFYIGHNLEPHQTSKIEPRRRIGIQYWFKGCPGVDQGNWWTRWDNGTLYMPWAADLLPAEIGSTVYAPDTREVFWVGSVWSDKAGGKEMGNVVETDQLRGALERHGLTLKIVRALDKDHAGYIQRSRIAPAMQGAWQIEKGYLPCRAFKNASFGQMVVTNNPLVRDLFNGYCAYGETIDQMVAEAMAFCCWPREVLTRHALRIVKERHCYTHRVEALMRVVEGLA